MPDRFEYMTVVSSACNREWWSDKADLLPSTVTTLQMLDHHGKSGWRLVCRNDENTRFTFMRRIPEGESE